MEYKLIINLKTYEESTDKKAIKIANICKELAPLAKKKKVEIILCPQYIDLKDIIKTKITTFSQHLDDINYGSHTGYIVPNVIKQIGAKGSLINHSEHNLAEDLKKLESTINAAKSTNLITCVCARDEKIARKITKFKPDYIAVEPKELIGGDISISTANPNLIKKSIKAVGNIPLLVGAGIKNKQDVKIAIELGAKGILVASGVVKAKNIKAAITDLIEGFS